MKIFGVDDQETMEFISTKDDKLFGQGQQIMYFLKNRYLQDAAQETASHTKI